ncbi:hypothetical protein [Thalassoglobus polymorphus]|uniref:Cytochrome C n=1 Tax=Thalassoglobus polymorphus TaxID=2527994 RepID=A0A517QUA7_9PLAN|nr:hypothetical protein [Thalassoglobus polymorphus]QDT35226.1 hypothetical protein Mal48_45020 [Thalassoglobus polymorphus]
MRKIPRIAFSLLAVLPFTILGCGGGGADSTPPESNASSAPAPAQVTTATTPQPAQPAASDSKVDPDRKETKWIGDIPYDVFYDQPLTVAANSTAIGGTAPASVVDPGTSPQGMAPKENSPAPETGGSPSAAGKADWAAVLPMPILIEELKTIRTRLTGNLQTVATYNRSAEAIALDGSMISAMGAITTVHPDAEAWKERGKFIRDLGYEIYSNSGESGRTAFKSVEDPFFKLQTAMDGGNVDLGDDVEEVVPFADVVYVSDMMQRIEITFSNLKANINTEARMKEDLPGVERELRILAALGTMMGTESYDNADAKQYQDFIAKFVGGAMNGAEAVKAEDYESFRAGLDQIQVTCAECHQQYRGSESGF